MNQTKKVLVCLLVLVLSLGVLSFAAAETVDSMVLNLWEDPSADENVDAKPMLRFWFPDAGAGLTQEEIDELNAAGLTTITEEYLTEVSDIITELYEAGFGGVEMTMLADSANYGTELVSEIGWGSKAWVRVLCQALMTGNSLGEGDGTSFKIDITMTAHWPLIIDTIDPNDDEQQQELSYTVQTIDADNIGETVTLDLPEQDVQDGKNAEFLFTDTLVSVVVAKQKSVEVEVQENVGSWDSPEYVTGTEIQSAIDYESLIELEATETEGYSAGVPEGVVIYQYSDGRYYDYALASTGDALGDPLAEGEHIEIFPSEDFYSFVDEENGGYIYIIDTESGEAIDTEGVTYERTDTAAQQGPTVTYSSTFAVYKDGEDISESVTVYFDAGSATNLAGKLVSADGTKTDIAVIANEDVDSFGIVTEEEATEENPATERQYMDDVQMIYSVSGADLQAAIDEIGPLEEGEEYVLIPVYRRGSGQVSSGGGTVTMDNRTYCISYYDSEGAHAVIDYWEEYMLDVEVDVYDADGNTVTVTLREMIAGNSAGSIFEDSLEMSTSGSVWGASMLEGFEEIAEYDAAKYMAIIAGLSVYNDEDGEADKILEDYADVKEEIFNEEHVKVISEWANEIGGGYRFQSGSDDARNSQYVDIIEADNGSLSSVLKAAGTVNAKGDLDNPYLSMEAITSTSIDADYYTTMIELNMNFVRGINRIVIHGIPFTQSFNGHINAWPGWVFGETALGKGYGAWDSRQAFYDEESDILTFTDYVTRIQGLVQEAQTVVPTFIVGSASDSAFEFLRDNGLQYNVTSEYGIMYDNMSPDNITDGVLHADTLETQVIVLNGLTSVEQYEFLERLIEYANAGIKIVIYGDTEISSITGVNYGEMDEITDENKTDEYVQQLYAELLANENTITGVDSEEALIEVLKANTNVTISYETDGLEVMHLTEGDSTDFYFFYNSAITEDSTAIQYGGVGEGLDLSNTTGVDVTSEITLVTDGASLYSLDAYSGDITEITNYIDNGDGTITFVLEIAAWDTAVLMVTDIEVEGAEAEVTEDAEIVLDLTDAAWDLTIESYGPATDFDDTASFNDTTISTLVFEDITLGLWSDLSDLVTRDDLIAIGITDEKLEEAAGNITGYEDKLLNGDSLTVDGNAIQYVSGVGTYTTTFTWDAECEGAILYFSHRDDSVTTDSGVNGDMITKITITNESGTYTYTGINQVSDELDIGDVLVAGENTIEVKLVTTLRNREWIEGAATGPSYNSMQTYGLTGLEIAVY